MIKPHVLWKDWSERSARIHGIDREQLEQQGHEVRAVAESLNEALQGVVYCDAWTFDSFWLHRLFKAAQLKPAFQLDSIASLLSDEQVQRWQDVHKQVIDEMKTNAPSGRK